MVRSGAFRNMPTHIETCRDVPERTRGSFTERLPLRGIEGRHTGRPKRASTARQSKERQDATRWPTNIFGPVGWGQYPVCNPQIGSDRASRKGGPSCRAFHLGHARRLPKLSREWCCRLQNGGLEIASLACIKSYRIFVHCSIGIGAIPADKDFTPFTNSNLHMINPSGGNLSIGVAAKYLRIKSLALCRCISETV